jgi:hypothetical protein
MRMYEPIWQKLKKDGLVKLAVPRPLHRRIIKAVIKEKDMDVVHKLVLLEKRLRQRISYTQNDSMIIIKLSTFESLVGTVCASDI